MHRHILTTALLTASLALAALASLHPKSPNQPTPKPIPKSSLKTAILYKSPNTSKPKTSSAYGQTQPKQMGAHCLP